jgi:hypothetical protein
MYSSGIKSENGMSCIADGVLVSSFTNHVVYHPHHNDRFDDATFYMDPEGHFSPFLSFSRSLQTVWSISLVL